MIQRICPARLREVKGGVVEGGCSRWIWGWCTGANPTASCSRPSSSSPPASPWLRCSRFSSPFGLWWELGILVFFMGSSCFCLERSRVHQLRLANSFLVGLIIGLGRAASSSSYLIFFGLKWVQAHWSTSAGAVAFKATCSASVRFHNGLARWLYEQRIAIDEQISTYTFFGKSRGRKVKRRATVVEKSRLLV